jgi:hypothetical protein
VTASLPVRINLQMLHDTFAKFPDAVAPTKENKSFYLAVAVLKHFFGEGWIERYLDRPGYLQIDETNQTTMDLKGLRLIDLSEVIYNLQYVENFDNCISRMRDGDIEGTAAELDLGRMLYLNQVPFRYIIPTGIKGKDYDAEIVFPDGTVACADAKCALGTADLKAKAIFNKLEKARQQLPPDQPSIIFAKMPAHWLEHPDFVSTTVDQAKELFRQTERIVSIKFYVAPTTMKGGYVMQQHAYKELSNPKTRFASRDWTLFRPFDPAKAGRGMPPHWQRILMFPDGPRYEAPPNEP